MKNFPFPWTRIGKAVWFGLLVVALLTASPTQAATWTVTSTADSATDTTTLRGAVNAAASGDSINLHGVTGTIALTMGEIGINKDLSIFGPGASNLAISGNNTSRVFHIQAGAASVTISGLTIENGNGNIDSAHLDDNGGAIRTIGSFLQLVECVITGNSATKYGGAIFVFQDMSLGLMDVTLSNNSAAYGGAGLDKRGQHARSQEQSQCLDELTARASRQTHLDFLQRQPGQPVQPRSGPNH